MKETDVERVLGRYAGTWSIWRSDTGRWYATRLIRALSRVQLDANLSMTVHADDAEALDELLTEQERMASAAPS
ncbi:hypothetical protein ACFYY8_20100 [Streptosporangium sp. NPDC001559]|uniref:hypothetical protein n=1 Tax=Streptosporangium sp. NPDC001559 TaxID=3366187 RepID=UPI0036E17546